MLACVKLFGPWVAQSQMDMDGQLQIVGITPEAIVGVAVERLAARKGGQQHAAQSELGDSPGLADALLDVVGGRQSNTNEAARIDLAEIGQEIVVGANTGELQLQVVDR